MSDEIVNQIGTDPLTTEPQPSAESAPHVAPEDTGEEAIGYIESDEVDPSAGGDDVDPEVADLTRADDNDSDEVRALKQQFERRWGRLQNRIRNEAKQKESNGSDPLVQQYRAALGALLNDPTAQGTAIQQLRQQFGVQPPGDPQRMEKRKQLLSRIEPEHAEAFGELTRDIAEREFAPMFQAAIDEVRQEMRTLLEERDTSTWSAMKAKYGDGVEKFRGQATKLVTAAKSAGIDLSLDQALMAASNGKVQMKQAVQKQRQTARASVESDTVPANRVNGAQPPQKNGQPKKLTPQDILKDYLKTHPGQRRAIEEAIPFAMRLR